jgi:hypothetical protein
VTQTPEEINRRISELKCYVIRAIHTLGNPAVYKLVLPNGDEVRSAFGSEIIFKSPEDAIKAAPHWTLDEHANAELLEEMPSPSLVLETLYAPAWRCWAQSSLLVPNDYGRHVNRKIAIALAWLKWKESQ